MNRVKFHQVPGRGRLVPTVVPEAPQEKRYPDLLRLARALSEIEPPADDLLMEQFKKVLGHKRTL